MLTFCGLRRVIQDSAVVGRVIRCKSRVKFLNFREFCRCNLRSLLFLTMNQGSTHVHCGHMGLGPLRRKSSQVLLLLLLLLLPLLLFRLLDHGWEMLLLNSSYGLARKSEESCEGRHKVGRCSFHVLLQKLFITVEKYLDDTFFWTYHPSVNRILTLNLRLKKSISFLNRQLKHKYSIHQHSL